MLEAFVQLYKSFEIDLFMFSLQTVFFQFHMNMLTNHVNFSLFEIYSFSALIPIIKFKVMSLKLTLL